MKRKVFAVTTGECSDYRVCALFEAREDAERVALLYGPADDYFGGRVEEFDLFSPGDASFHARPEAWAVLSVRPDGTFFDERSGVERTIADADPYSFQVTRRGAGYQLVLYGAEQETVEKAIRERGARVAALMVEGVDPMTVEWGGAKD